MSRITKAIVPAAGLGTRLRPLSELVPKEMFPVGRKAALQLIYEELAACEIDDVLFITSAAKPLLERFCSEALAQLNGPRVHLIRQPEPLGLADAVRYGEAFADGEDVAVALGDTVVHTHCGAPRLEELIRVFVENHAALAILVEEVPRERVFEYGIVKPKGQTNHGPFPIEDIVEKPAIEEAPSCWAVGGRYVFRPAIFDAIRRTKPGHKNELQLTDSIRIMLREGASGWVLPVEPHGSRHDIGLPESYMRAFIELAARDEVFGEEARAFMRQLTQGEARPP